MRFSWLCERKNKKNFISGWYHWLPPHYALLDPVSSRPPYSQEYNLRNYSCNNLQNHWKSPIHISHCTSWEYKPESDLSALPPHNSGSNEFGILRLKQSEFCVHTVVCHRSEPSFQIIDVSYHFRWWWWRTWHWRTWNEIGRNLSKVRVWSEILLLFPFLIIVQKLLILLHFIHKNIIFFASPENDF